MHAYNERNIKRDEEIICDILDGHTEAFRLLVERHATSVLHLVGRILPSTEDAKDVVQDAFVAAYQSLSNYDHHRASFKTWLCRIACHIALKRVQSGNITFVPINQDELDNIPDTDIDQSLCDASPDRLSLLDKAVKQLSAADQLLLSLYYYDNRRLKEVASILDCTDAYLRSRLQWIRKKLCHTINILEKNENK